MQMQLSAWTEAAPGGKDSDDNHNFALAVRNGRKLPLSYLTLKHRSLNLHLGAYR